MTDIVERIDALNELIQDLLLFARPRALRLQALDIRALIDKSVAVVQRDPAAAGVDFAVTAPAIALQGDAELLHAALLNVLLNALQAMHGAGVLVISGRTEHGRCVIEVEDSGPGVPEDIREKIFEPFFTTRSRGGGLGLPIARRTLEVHGGAISLRCPESGGTVVRLELPLTPPALNTASLALSPNGDSSAYGPAVAH